HRPQRARRRKPPLDQNLRPKPYMKAGHFSAKIPGQLSAEININALLNYGYTVLRSLVARSVVAAGLHPSIGIHHANRGNAFALADDLIEPFRPLVDLVTVKLAAKGCSEVSSDAKRAYASLIALDLPGEDGTTTVTMAATYLSQSLARSFETGKASNLAPPRPPSAIELAGLGAVVT
ncbi:CRISPR-associated endonuclease Cas1, partial [Ollibium composti]